MKTKIKKNFLNKKDIEQYKNFAFKQDMLKMSVAFILGGAFNKVVTGISDFVIMPILNFIISQTGYYWRKWNWEPTLGLRFEIGQFLGVMVDFFLISFILYLIYSKILIKIQGDLNTPIIKTKICNFCKSEINEFATKCPKCTGDLNVQTRRTRRTNKRTKNSRGK